MAPIIPPKYQTPFDDNKDYRMSALFNFQSLCLVIVLLICTSTYVHAVYPSILDRQRDGYFGIFWKFARIGERLSPYVSISCILMAIWYMVE